MIRNHRGLSLIELVTVMVLIGILASIAIPTYTNSVQESRKNEARVNLQAIHLGQKVYALNHSGNFWGPGNQTRAISDINTNLNIDLTANYYRSFNFHVNNDADPDYVIRATNPDNNDWVRINEDGDIVERS